MRWRQLPIVAFDTETTGLEPFQGDRIIEVAVVTFRLDEQGQVLEKIPLSHLVNPGVPIPRKVTEITGISDADVADAPRFADIAEEIHAVLASGVVVAHNLPFDHAFLSQEFRAVGLSWPEPVAEIDTLDLSIRLFSDARTHKLADVSSRLDVRLEGAHRATNDAEACGEVFVRLARRHDVSDDLQGLLDWANAIGRPPEHGGLATDDDGRVIFADGPAAGKPVADDPVRLAWMEKARERGPDGWRWRYPDSVRRWVRRYLDVRGAGRSRQNPKGTHVDTWSLDSCIVPERRGMS